MSKFALLTFSEASTEILSKVFSLEYDSMNLPSMMMRIRIAEVSKLCTLLWISCRYYIYMSSELTKVSE